MKKYLKEISVLLIIIFLIPLIFSIFNLFEIEIYPLIYLVSIALITFSSGIILGINTKNNAYKKGLLLGIIFVLIMFLLSIIMKSTMSFKMISYYLIVIVSTTLGSILGIQKR